MGFDLQLMLVNLLLGGSIVFLIWSLFRFPVRSETPVHRQFAQAVGVDQRSTLFENRMLAPLMSLSLTLAERFSFPAIREMIRDNLNASGNDNGYSIEEYLALCIVTGLGLGAAGGVLSFALIGQFDLLIIMLLLAVGFAIPIYSLRGEARKRVSRISKRLPYTLDLIALTMAAGSTFSEAIDTIIRDDPEDDLNQELRLVQAEIEVGTTRAVALRNMAERIPLDTLRSIVGAVNQAESLGTPLSTILKNQAGMLRMHRSVRAEKLSASASLRILVPSMLILMAVVLCVFGPMIMRWVRGDFNLRM